MREAQLSAGFLAAIQRHSRERRPLHHFRSASAVNIRPVKDLKDAPEPLLRCVRLNNLESLDCQANLTVFKRDFPFGPLNVQGLDKRFNASMERGREEIPWAMMVCILALARSCAPSSELQIGESWHGVG